MTNLKLFEIRKLFRKHYRLHKNNMKSDRFDIVNSSAVSWLDSNFQNLDFHNTIKTKDLISDDLFSEIDTTLNVAIINSSQDIKKDWFDLYARGILYVAKDIKKDISEMMNQVK